MSQDMPRTPNAAYWAYWADQAELDAMNPMPHEPQTWINTLWTALDHARESFTDEQWDEITMAMQCNTEELGCIDPIILEDMDTERSRNG